MGYSFSNIHIKKQENITLQQVKETMLGYFAKNSYQLVDKKSEADFALYILEPDSRWYSACCDAIDFSDSQSIRTICEPISSELHTDVIASSCFDSDFLFLNLINMEQNVDAWVGFGHDESNSFHRKNSFRAWNSKVSDIESFKQILKKQYVFAEEAWNDIEPLLQMQQYQGTFSQDCLDEFREGLISVLYFRSTSEKNEREPAKLSIQNYDLMPCKIGKDKIISAVNLGGASKGIGIAFSGSYVETNEISFRDVQIEYHFDRHPRKIIPLTLERIRTVDNRWIYYATVPDFPIPEGVKEGLPAKRSMDEIFKRSFGVRFTPEGNPRKCLDICIHFIPLSNRKDQCCWCVWFYEGSKRAYIEAYNNSWLRTTAPDLNEILLNPDDFDDIG